jgi:hypothetical protein
MSQESDAALQALQDQVTKSTDAEAAAVLLLNGIAARIDAAVAGAILAHPSITAEQLAGITAETASLKKSAEDLGSAIIENT